MTRNTSAIHYLPRSAGQEPGGIQAGGTKKQGRHTVRLPGRDYEEHSAHPKGAAPTATG